MGSDSARDHSQTLIGVCRIKHQITQRIVPGARQYRMARYAYGVDEGQPIKLRFGTYVNIQLFEGPRGRDVRIITPRVWQWYDSFTSASQNSGLINESDRILIVETIKQTQTYVHLSSWQHYAMDTIDLANILPKHMFVFPGESFADPPGDDQNDKPTNES